MGAGTAAPTGDAATAACGLTVAPNGRPPTPKGELYKPADEQ